jgi:Xaa-Pro dipeptidase
MAKIIIAPLLEDDMHGDRVKKLRAKLKKFELDALAVIPGASMFYLTGLSFHLSERPKVTIFTTEARPILILPKLELAKAEASSLEFSFYTYEEDEASRTSAFQKAANTIGVDQLKLGFEPLSMRAFELNLMKNSMPGTSFISAPGVTAELRNIKDDFEISSIRKAVSIAEKAMMDTIPLIKVGMTERELAADLVVNLLRCGSEPELPFFPIVASGPNSALPHAVPTNRKFQVGDLLILDWGARVNGYVSDLTRTFAIGDLNEEMKKIYEVVKAANRAGLQAIGPDIPCSDIDRASRSVITSEGFGEYFIHRTGHGFGLEAHEGPYIREDNEELLAPGMTFTVEPGIYIPNQGGVRIEDNVFVTPDGGDSLSTFSRELQVLL